MVDYEWTNPSSILFPFEEEPTLDLDQIFHQDDQNLAQDSLFQQPFRLLQQEETQINLDTLYNSHSYTSVDTDLVGKLAGGGSAGSGCGSVWRCQARGCKADLTQSKAYHKRHKVCEVHFKAESVLTGGLIQRFCQQCSRFHRVSEFDQGKRSCRKRLAAHNRRRWRHPQEQQ